VNTVFSTVIARLITLMIILLLPVGCATLTPEFDPPKVTVESVKALPSRDMGPRFEIKLRVVNPNQQALDIAGISYAIEIFDKELVNGVANDVPVIEGYSEETVDLEAGINMFQILRLLAELGQVNASAPSLDYRFTAKIDFNGFIPTQRVEETGSIALN